MRFRACLLAFIFIACAPSVPRPTRAPPAPDAHVDAPATPPVTIDARADSRPLIEPAVDARAATDVAADAVAKADASKTDTAVKADTGTAPSDGPANRDRPIANDGVTDGAIDADAEGAGSDGPAATVPSAGDVVIDELLINPAGTDTNREWIEIANLTSFTLDLRQLHVADAASDVAVDAGLIAPGGLLVLGQSLDPTKNGGAPIAASFGNVISLNNGGDSISICLGPCASGVVLDQVIWTADPGAAFDGHAAMVGATPGQFCAADQPFGDAGSFGSPGAPNPPCAD